MKGKRIKYMDMAKGIGIILIVICHNPINDVLNDWFFSFHVPLFFIVSGFFMKEGFSSKSFKKDILHLWVPCLLCCFVVFMLNIDYSEEIHWNVLNYLAYRIVPKTGWEVIGMWFLPALFWGKTILAVLLTKIKEKKYVYIITLFLFFISSLYPFFQEYIDNPLYIINGFAVPLFLCIGMLMKEHHLIEYNYNKYMKGVGILFMIVAFYFPVNMFTNSFPVSILNVVISSIVCLGVCMCCRKFEQHKNKLSRFVIGILAYYGKYSLVILCAHALFHYPLRNCFLPINDSLWGISEVIVLSSGPLVVSFLPGVRYILNVPKTVQLLKA